MLLFINMWIIYALLASAFWGLNYLFFEKLLAKLSLFGLLAIQFSIIGIVFALLAYFRGELSPTLNTITNAPSLFKWLFILGLITSIIAELTIGASIQSKNATLAGLIEISYPIFIALFSIIIFRQNNITWSVIIGGLLIFGGISVVYFFNR